MDRLCIAILVLILAGCQGDNDKRNSGQGETVSARTEALEQNVEREQDAFTITSPDEDIIATITDSGGQLHYSVVYHGEKVVASSLLGMRFKDQHAFENDLVVIRQERFSSFDTWEQPWGEQREIRDEHNTMRLTVQDEAHGGYFILALRIFDDGVGFRYEVPRQAGYENVSITNELTEFTLNPQSTAWWIPARKWNRYEYIYQETPVSEMPMVHTPVTIRTPAGTHMSIHEAALVNYSGMSLKDERAGQFKADLAPSSSGALVDLETPFKTPWRTLQLSNDAAGLINSHLILNLNEPNKLGDVSWVEPGKYVGIWWGMHMRDMTWGSGPYHGATTKQTERYMDFAAKYGFAGVLVEGWNIGWDGDWYHNGDIFSFTKSYPDFDLAAVTAHGLKEGVRLIGHHETSGSLTNYENQMKDAFDLYEKNGVRQVKTGYVADAGALKWIDDKGVARYEYHDGQYSVNHHIRVLQEAAKHKISINSHEPVKDTGLRRTYPNWISREGARGSEYDAWGVPPNPPSHTAILPFTRMLAGPMDYTPGIFELRPSELPPIGDDFTRNDPRSRIETTLMKQLALYVVLYSPIQMAADLPRFYEARPDAFAFIQDVPVDWERSVALQGEIGDFVVVARQERGAPNWYLGALTNEDPRALSIPLTFLDEGVRYQAKLFRDGPTADYQTNPYDYVIEQRVVTRDDVIELALGASGGAAISFKPVKDE